MTKTARAVAELATQVAGMRKEVREIVEELSKLRRQVKRLVNKPEEKAADKNGAQDLK